MQVTDKGLMVNGLPITLSSTRDPTEIPWKDTGVRAAQWLARTRRGYIIVQERYRTVRRPSADTHLAPIRHIVRIKVAEDASRQEPHIRFHRIP